MLFRQYRPLTKTGFFLNRGFLLNRFFLKKWFFRDPNILHTQASKTSFLTSLLFQNVLSCVQKMLGDDFDTFSGYSVPPPDLGPYWEKRVPKTDVFSPPIGILPPLLVWILLTGFFRFRARWKKRDF